MMLSDKLKELEATRTRLAELEQSIAAERDKELAALPAQYGFENAAAFIAAVRAAGGKRRGRKPGSKSGVTAAAKTSSVRRKKRAKVTDETRAEVKKLAEQGKTGAEIAKAVGVSLPTVQNIKKALGLVRKKK